MEHLTERLSLREFGEPDFDLFYSLFSDPQVMRYAWRDRFEAEREALPYFREILQHNGTQENRRAYEYTVISRKTGVFVGMGDIEIMIRNEHGGCGEIGYFLLPEHWGMGYATEITGKLLEMCFDTLRLHKAVASCNANNKQSERVMQKAGMEREGLFRQMRWKDGRWDDELRYSILAGQWLAERT